MLTLNINADSSGLLSARPLATAVISGYVYFSHDISQYSVSNHVIWLNPNQYNAMELLLQSGLLTNTPLLSTINFAEAVAPSGVAGYDILYADSTAHRLKMLNNNGSADTVVGAATTDTLTNKTITLKDANFTIQDNSDVTKQLQFELSGITTGTTRTLTVPNASDTLVGKATTDTFTNKTHSLAGSGNVTGDAIGNITRYHRTIYWEYANVANLADTNYISNTAFVLAAGLMSVNGDRLYFDAIWTFDATAATKTYIGNIGYTSWAADGTGFTGGQSIVSSSTTTTSATVISRSIIERLTATTGAVYGTLLVSTSDQVTAYTTFSITWANAQNILFETKSSVSTAGISTIRSIAIQFMPYT